MIVNGTNDDYLDRLLGILGIGPENLTSFKYFLQDVEDMQITIDGIRTYISQSADEKF
jgi:hypothetical protein